MLGVHPVYLRPVTFASDYRLSRTSSVDARKTISGEYGAGFIVIGGNDGFTPPPPPTVMLYSAVRFVSMYGRKSPGRSADCERTRTHISSDIRFSVLAAVKLGRAYERERENIRV